MVWLAGLGRLVVSIPIGSSYQKGIFWLLRGGPGIQNHRSKPASQTISWAMTYDKRKTSQQEAQEPPKNPYKDPGTNGRVCVEPV